MDNTVRLSDAVTCKLQGTLEVHKYGVGSAAPRSAGVGSLKWNGDSYCPPFFFGLLYTTDTPCPLGAHLYRGGGETIS